MADNTFFKEVFEREFSRLQATGISKQTAAAQALVSAQSIVTEMQRHQYPLTPSSIVAAETSVSSTESFDRITSSPGASHQNNLSDTATTTEKSAVVATIPVTDTYDQDKRKGKLAANVYSTLNKKSPAARFVTKVPPSIVYEELKRILSECLHSGDFSPIIRLVGSSFSSAESLNESFCFPIKLNSILSSPPPPSSSSLLKQTSNSKGIDPSSMLSQNFPSGEKMTSANKITMDDTTSPISTCTLSSQSKSVAKIEKPTSKFEEYNQTDLKCEQDNLPSTLDRISINIDQVSDVFQLLFSCGNEGVQNSLYHALVNLSYNMPLLASTCVTASSLKHIIIVLEHPQLLDPKYEILLRNILIGIDKLPSRSKKIIALWLRDSAGEKRYRVHLTVFRQFMTLKIMQG